MNNYHKELMKILPTIFKNENNVMEKLFEQMIVDSPKEILDAFNKIYGISDNTPSNILSKIIRDFTGITYTIEELSPAVSFCLNGNNIKAANEIKSLTNLSLAESINNILTNFIEYIDIYNK